MWKQASNTLTPNKRLEEQEKRRGGKTDHKTEINLNLPVSQLTEIPVKNIVIQNKTQFNHTLFTRHKLKYRTNEKLKDEKYY